MRGSEESRLRVLSGALMLPPSTLACLQKTALAVCARSFMNDLKKAAVFINPHYREIPCPLRSISVLVTPSLHILTCSSAKTQVYLFLRQSLRMRISATLLLLPALGLAQSQIPLGDYSATLNSWFEKAKSYIPPSVYSPTATAAAKVASKNVVPITKENWATTLVPSASASTHKGADNWMILVSGGNKTCHGMCENVDRAWNESAALFAADPTSPHLGYLDCETEKVLCAMWFAGPAAVWYIQLPVPAVDQSKPATTVHIVKLNTTSTTAREIMEIHTKKTYEKTPVHEGWFHPFDGPLARYKLNVPIGYFLWAFSLVPSWTFMLLISFISRTIV